MKKNSIKIFNFLVSASTFVYQNIKAKCYTLCLIQTNHPQPFQYCKKLYASYGKNSAHSDCLPTHRVTKRDMPSMDKHDLLAYLIMKKF